MTAILLAAIAVVLVEATLAFSPGIAWSGDFQGRNLKLPPQQPDLLIMGDSAAERGIVASQVTENLPGHPFVYNSALAASGPEFSYFILKRQIDAGMKPDAVIYAPSPHTFASKRVPLLVGGFCTWPEVFEVVKQGVEPCDVAYGVLCKVSYTLRYREQLGAMLRGRMPVTAANEALPGDMRAATQHYTRAMIHPMFMREFQTNRFNEVFLEKFLALAQENHVPVYWAIMPVPSVVHEIRQPLQFEENYVRFLDDLSERHDVKLLARDFRVYDDGLFADQVHLSTSGAQQFTRYLGEMWAAYQEAHEQPALGTAEKSLTPRVPFNGMATRQVGAP